MNIASEGIKAVLICAAIAGLGGLVSIYCKPTGITIAVLGLVLTLFSAFFFRDPERPGNFGPDEIVCPGDGTVLTVQSEGNSGITVVRIFLSILSVHIQRAPLEGRVESINYSKGTFFIASKPEASRNERNRIRITGAGGKFAEVEQIAGTVARRIACWVKTGQEVKAGERLGMIYFGSQVALYLPSTAKILVKPGDKVYGAKTILGRW